MKFRVTMKDPDTLYDAINEAVTEALAPLLTVLTKDESQTYVLRPGSRVTLKAFANLRGKNWKTSMVFSCSPEV